MSKVQRQTYADHISINLHQYRDVHGIIEEFGGRVKQFSQDVEYPGIWIIFFEMAKTQEVEFNEALKELKVKL